MTVITAAAYLEQTCDTVEHVFNAIGLEENRISDAAHILPAGIGDADLRSAQDYFYQRYASMEWSEDYDDRQLMHAFQQYAASARLIVLHEISAGILYGALLQIAKQAISIAHGNGRNCGLGREVAGLSLAQIIWDARNQALHFEEVAKAATMETFGRLVVVFGDGLSLTVNPGKNMARGVVRDVLGWNDSGEFSRIFCQLLVHPGSEAIC